MVAAALEMPVMPVIEVPEEGDETRRDYGGGTFESKNQPPL
jgi:hypothetical protein